MSTDKQYTDNFKNLFDNTSLPDLPDNLEEKIMADVEIYNLKQKPVSILWFTRNLVIFSMSIMILALLAVVQFVTELNFSLLNDFRTITLLSTGIFFVLWAMETADGLLQNRFHNKLQ